MNLKPGDKVICLESHACGSYFKKDWVLVYQREFIASNEGVIHYIFKPLDIKNGSSENYLREKYFILYEEVPVIKFRYKNRFELIKENLDGDC